ncbi:MAG: GNAT family N-acetyltransferase [Oscillospiraceae bacterium]|jgi:GNAT superfamily N-acetyltransferase|nr:GNAT family N-acetyltransferase [Oscillospiraceae bacterium]
MSIIVRKATRADIPQILALYKELNPLDPPIDKSRACAVFEKAGKSGVTYFVAADDTCVKGTCYIAIIPNMSRQCSPVGFVENVVVAADCRRQGVGRGLISAAVDFAKERGCYKVVLQSGVKRKEAHRFYESLGFDGDSKRAFEIRF